MSDLGDGPLRVNVMFERAAAGDIAERVAQAGLVVEQELDLLAIITGRIPAERVAELESVEGVLAVEPDRGVEIQGPGTPAG